MGDDACDRLLDLANQDEAGSSEKLGALLSKWAADAFVQFVSRSDGLRTTTTVSRDALLLLVERAMAAERERKISGIYGLESAIVQVLNEARCLEKRTVGNRELASRLMSLLRNGAGAAQIKAVDNLC